MDVRKLQKVFCEAAEAVREQEQKFSDLDAMTGDGDHGVTITKICGAVIEAAEDGSVPSESAFFAAMCDNIMEVNGGSVAPIWAMMMDGTGAALKDGSSVSPEAIRDMLRGALEGISGISQAKAGEKTMVDPLTEALKAAETASGDWKTVLAAASAAGEKGSEATRNMPAKYGRAKNLPDKGVGHLDPGAVSFSCFLTAISNAANTI